MGIPRLYELQQVDLAIARVSAHRASLNDGTAEREAVTQAAAHRHDLQQQLAALRAQLRALELEAQSLQQKRAGVEADMYSGRVRNPKELASMQEELSGLDRQRSRLDDEMLGLLEEVERLEPQERGAAAALEAAQASLSRQTASFQQAAEAADREMVSLNGQRESLVGGLEEHLVRRYDRLRERKGGVAIVAVDHGICEGCHVAIPARLLRRLEDDPETMAACDGCGRLLYVPPRR